MCYEAELVKAYVQEKYVYVLRKRGFAPFYYIRITRQ